MKTTVDIAAVLAGKPLEQCVKKIKSKAQKRADMLALHDRVTYQRQNMAGEPLGAVKGFIDEMTRTSCSIFDTATGDLVAASLSRVRKVGS